MVQVTKNLVIVPTTDKRYPWQVRNSGTSRIVWCNTKTYKEAETYIKESKLEEQILARFEIFLEAISTALDTPVEEIKSIITGGKHIL